MWLINVINIVTGNLDRAGGVMIPRPAVDLLAMSDRNGNRGFFNRNRSRVRDLPEFSGEYPVATLAEEILTEGPGQIRAMVMVAGNPVLSTPNGRQLDAALAKLDFMVAVDIYVNETTRHGHVILPPTTALEHDNYAIVEHGFAIRNTAKYSEALFAPAEDMRHDWEILLGARPARDRARDGAGARGGERQRCDRRSAARRAVRECGVERCAGEG